MSIAIIETVRPKQWYKNLLVFLPLIASLNLTEINAVIFSLFAFSVLCISSGGWYVVNDLIDYKKDLLHPQKKNRPIPSGRFSKKQAIVLATSLLAISEILSLMINLNFFVEAHSRETSGQHILFLIFSCYEPSLGDPITN